MSARVVVTSLAMAAMIGCAVPTVPLLPPQFPDPGGKGPGYRFENLAGGEGTPEFRDANRLFVCLAFSGGGTRAAALAYGAMVALRQTRIDWPHPGSTLLDEVDCISSVSGGSFTAAYYGLFRDDLFTRFAERFLYRNIQGRLALKALSPWNWPRLASPYFSRIDLAAELYDDQLFDHARYADLIRQARRPFIILNATNIATGTRFPFTQSQFDLIGSDLGPYPVARGVAASSAFPFLLSPLTLTNHQPLEGFPVLTEYKLGTKDYYVNRSRYYRSRTQLAYVDHPHPYVHLMDGGLADNVGLRSIINAYEQTNGFVRKNSRRIERLVVIAVNARTQSEDCISDHRHTPHIIPTVAFATATTSMDNYSFETVDLADRLTNELRQAKLVHAQSPGQPEFHAPIPYVAEISFEAIPDAHVRDAFFGVSTSFQLPAEQVQALISTGCELLKSDPVFRCLLEDIEREAAGRHGGASACDDEDAHVTPRAVEQIVCPPPGPWPPP
jgi:NTE family protein